MLTMRRCRVGLLAYESYMLYDEAGSFIQGKKSQAPGECESRPQREPEQWEREIKYSELVASSHKLGLEYAQLKNTRAQPWLSGCCGTRIKYSSMCG